MLQRHIKGAGEGGRQCRGRAHPFKHSERATFQPRLEGYKEQGMIIFGGRAFLAEGTASSGGWTTPGVLNDYQAGGWSAEGKGGGQVEGM